MERTSEEVERLRFAKALERLENPFPSSNKDLRPSSSSSNPLLDALGVLAMRGGFEIRRPSMEQPNETALDPVMFIAEASGIRCRKVSLTGKWWINPHGDLLGYRQDGTPVALLQDKGYYKLFDSVSKEICKVQQKQGSELHPEAYVFFRSLPDDSNDFATLLRFGLVGTRREIATIILSGAASGLLGVIIPFGTGEVFDKIIPAADVSSLFAMGALLLVVSFSLSIFNYLTGLASLRLEGKLGSVIQPALWDRLLKLPMPFFRRYPSGEITQRSFAVSAMQTAITGSTFSVLLTSIFSFFTVALLVFYSPYLAAIAILLAFGGLLIDCLVSLSLLRTRRLLAEKEAGLSSTLVELLGGVAKFRSTATERRAFSFWAHRFSALKEAGVAMRRKLALHTTFRAVYPSICLGMLFWANVQVHSLGGFAMSTGSFVGFLVGFSQLSAITAMLGAAVTNLISAKATYEICKPILEAVPHDVFSTSLTNDLTGKIDVSELSFRYSADSPPVLNGVSFSVRPGEFVAFVGASGSGKSTLLRLLLGLDRPDVGAVYYDDRDLAGLHLQSLRRKLGVVLQGSIPMNASIQDNVIGGSLLSSQDAWNALRLACLEDEVRQMPMGLYTHVSDGGSNLSGGQRQRLMLARAVVSSPRVLLLDEATSALDSHTQESITKALGNIQATRIIIAHRLSTVVNADRIFVLKNGRICESGSYSELMSLHGEFAALVREQMQGNAS